MSRPILEIREGVGGWIVQTRHDEVPVSLTGMVRVWATCYEDREYQVEVLEEEERKDPHPAPRRAIRVTVWED